MSPRLRSLAVVAACVAGSGPVAAGGPGASVAGDAAPSAAAAAAAVVEPTEDAAAGECAGPADGECALSLRQLRSGRRMFGAASQAPGMPLDGARSLALEGGGWHSVNAFAGVTAGLLAAYANLNGPNQNSLNTSRLYEEFAAISSVSGGTWFFASLAYSQEFADVIDSIAADPSDAAAKWDKGWVQRVVTMGKEHNRFESLLDRVGGLDAKLEDLRMFEMARETGFLWKDDDKTWVDWIGSMLMQTAGIEESTKLGDAQVSSWARGKTWLLDHSIIAASKDSPAHLWSGDGQMTYWMVPEPGETLPAYIPAVFSVKLGEEGAPAPLPYVSEAAKAAMSQIRYEGKRWQFAKAKVQDSADAKFALPYISPGVLPLHAVVAASSAAAGALCMSPFASLIHDFLDVDFTPWMAAQQSGAFQEGWSQVSQKARPRELAKEQVRGVIDGGYTDNTAIAHLVANGATKVVSFLDVGEKDYSKSFAKLFDQGNTVNGLSGGGNSRWGVPFLAFPIFAENATLIKEEFLNLPKVYHPGSKYLKHLSIGTLHATTVDNKWMGTTAGRKVAIHVVSVSSLVWVNTLNEFTEYSEFVAEITNALSAPANADLVRTELLEPMLS